MALPQGLTVTPVPQVSASGSSPAPTSSIPTFVPPNVAFHNMAFATATGNTMPQPQPAMQPVPQVSSPGSIPASTSSLSVVSSNRNCRLQLAPWILQRRQRARWY